MVEITLSYHLALHSGRALALHSNTEIDSKASQFLSTYLHPIPVPRYPLPCFIYHCQTCTFLNCSLIVCLSSLESKLQERKDFVLFSNVSPVVEKYLIHNCWVKKTQQNTNLLEKHVNHHCIKNVEAPRG